MCLNQWNHHTYETVRCGFVCVCGVRCYGRNHKWASIFERSIVRIEMCWKFSFPINFFFNSISRLCQTIEKIFRQAFRPLFAHVSSWKLIRLLRGKEQVNMRCEVWTWTQIALVDVGFAHETFTMFWHVNHLMRMGRTDVSRKTVAAKRATTRNRGIGTRYEDSSELIVHT